MEQKRGDDGMAFLLRYENVAWYEDGRVRILDRRVYPMRTEYVVCESYTQVAQAIADMVTQSGGPYTAAAMGMALAAHEAVRKNVRDIDGFLAEAADTLAHARPTTSKEMEAITARSLAAARDCLAAGKSGQALVDALFQSAYDRLNGNYLRYRTVGRLLGEKIPKNGTVMTQCFAETVIGTLLVWCREQGSAVRVICPETRPYFQGARLTASCVRDMGFEVTVITDNMPGFVMKEKGVDVFTSAADVITMDGHIVNKVGTFQIALCAAYHGIPYYATGAPDPAHPGIGSVKIELRDPALAMEALGTRVTMEGVQGYYPAFDVTPPKLCDGIVTDRGVFAPGDLNAYFN